MEHAGQYHWLKERWFNKYIQKKTEVAEYSSNANIQRNPSKRQKQKMSK